MNSKKVSSVFPSYRPVELPGLGITLELISLGDWSEPIAVRGWTAGPHYHRYYEIHMQLGGASDVMIEDRLLTLNDDVLLLIPPYASHYTIHPNESCFHYSFLIALTETEKPNDSEYHRLFGKITEARLFPCSPLLTELCRKIVALMESNNKNTDMLYKTIDAMIFFEAAEIMKKFLPERSDDPSVTEPISDSVKEEDTEKQQQKYLIDQYIDSDFDKKPSYQNLADKMHISRSHCIKLVRTLTGNTLHDLILRQRMITASRLVRSTKTPFTHIAEEIGFNSYSGFYIAYRQYFGKTPENDRQQYSNPRENI